MARRLAFFLTLLLAATVRSGEGEVRLLTDEAIPRYLARGQQLARSGEWAKMIDILQRVIVGDNEIFPELDPETLNSAVHTSDGILYYPARELCVKELSQLPPEGLGVYRATFDPPAAELMKEAREAETLEERLEKLTKVFDTYLVSSAGDDALEAAADLHLQLGHYFECLALLRRLLDVYPSDSDRDLAMARTKAAYCAARIGDAETRRDMLERLAAEAPGRRVLVEGERVAVEDLAEHPVMKVVGAIDMGGLDDWPMPGGNATRSRLGEDLPADLPREPFWRFSLQKRDSRYWAPIGRWTPRFHDREQAVAPASPQDDLAVAPYPTVRPVVHDDVLYFKDYLELVSRRVGSGELTFGTSRIWLMKAPLKVLQEKTTLPVGLVRPGTGGDIQPTAASDCEAAYRWYDYGGNGVVVTSSQIVVTATEKRPNQLITTGAKAQPNSLVVHRLDDGKAIWGWDKKGDLMALSVYRDPTLREEWKRDHSEHPNSYFRGPGVVSGGILYTLVEEHDGPKENPGGVSLWGFRMRDGRVLFRTQLHHHDDIATKLPVDASIAVAGAVVYVLTNSGILAAVDALPPGRIRWIRRYPRSFGNRARGAAKRIHMLFAHNEPVIAGGKVIIMPSDGSVVQGIDAETGRRDWELEPRELGDVRHVVGVRNQTLVLAGSDVTAVDIQSGKILWSHEHLGENPGLPYGRGFLSDKIAYIPAVGWLQRTNDGRSYVHRFEIDTGKRLDRYVFDVPRLGNILCLDGRLIACNEDEVMCFTTLQHERKLLDARIAEGGAHKAQQLLERALVTLRADPTARDAALADLRAADAAGQNATRIEVRWRWLELLLEKARATKDVAPLEEAREVAAALRATRRRLPEKYDRRPYDAQIALVEAEILADGAEPELAVERLQKFVENYPEEEVRVDGRILPAPAAARALRQRLMSIDAFRAAFERIVTDRIRQAAEKRDKATLAAISEQFGRQSPAEEAWFALARLHLEDGEPGKAEEALRTVLRDFPEHPRRAEAHLQLAVLLARNKLVTDARHERDLGLALLDAEGRTRHAEQIAELAKLLPDAARSAPRPALELPLRTEPFHPEETSPIPVEGKTPEKMAGCVILSDGPNVTAVDQTGKVLWRVPNPAASALEAAPREAGAAAVASAIANARFARWIGQDLLIGDLFGVQRIDSVTGNVAWKRPESSTEAATSAVGVVKLLRASMATLAGTGHLNRTSPLPAHVVRGDAIIRIHPDRGVAAFSLETGALLWEEKDATGAIAGEPSQVGQLLAVGRAEPGAIDIFDLGAGRRLDRLKAPGEVLLCAPVLDRLGRLYLIAASDPTAREAAFHVVEARDGSALLERPIEVHSRYATILNADETQVVFHDGSSGGDNLHFLELDGGKHARVSTEDISRAVHVVKDGRQLFVLTHKPGLADEGARLFRVDLGERAALRYERPRARLVYGRPLLTSRYVGVVGSDGQQASVQLYEREDSRDLSPPAPVFPVFGGAKMNSVLDFEPAGNAAPRFDLPPALAAAGSGLVVGHPFGIFRLRARDAR